MEERDWREIMRRCERWLGQRRPVPAAELLKEAAAALPSDAWPDRYGEGEFVETFERRIAELLGKKAAVLLPSGTMAQQIALRIHCDRRGLGTVAFHPTCHLELHEHSGYAHLHGLKAELVGDRDRLITLEDLEALGMPIGALLIELPQREIGGRLPEWEDLLAQIGWARERNIATHLDGARIWESAPYYGRSHAEIGTLFDTVYVSLYKGLGGLGGSVLAGPEDLVAETRVWQRRHGGALFSLFPLAAAAQRGLDEADHARTRGGRPAHPRRLAPPPIRQPRAAARLPQDAAHRKARSPPSSLDRQLGSAPLVVYLWLANGCLRHRCRRPAPWVRHMDHEPGWIRLEGGLAG